MSLKNPGHSWWPWAEDKDGRTKAEMLSKQTPCGHDRFFGRVV